jgi:trans-aconitate 2-methyltransferase
MATDTWNPTQYDRFKQERSQPFYDLVDLLRPMARPRVVDLGCGTGGLTAVLMERTNAKEALGLDSSASMLAKQPEASRLRFELGDIATFQEPGWDLVFSNAAFHWLPNHPALFEQLTRLLLPGGQLAVQMPANNDHPTHVVAHALAREAPYASAMQGYEREWPVLAPEAYAALLFQLGYAQQHVRLQVYPHVLDSRDDAVEWVKGTLLTDYEKRLGPELFARFLAEYRVRLAQVLPDARPFFFPFKRILLWGRRPNE